MLLETSSSSIGPSRRNDFFLTWFVLTISAIIIMLFDLLDGVLFLGDVDDDMRLLQIRDLLRDHDWFDLTLPQIAMPEAYLSPWSRLVDLPYFLIAFALEPFIGKDTGLFFASKIVPPSLLVLFAALMSFIVTQSGNMRPRPFHIAAMAVLMTLAIWEFTPGRIDHHNVQMLLMLSMLAGFFIKSQKVNGLGGYITGASAILSIVVGLECLPFIGIAFCIISIFAILGDEKARQHLSKSGLGIVIMTSLCAAFFLGPNLFKPACDAWSFYWVVIGLSSGLISTSVSLQIFQKATPYQRAIYLSLLSLCVIAAILVSFPQCLNGPYHMVDQVARYAWLDRVALEMNFIAYFAARRYDIIISLIVAAFLLIGRLLIAPSFFRAQTFESVLIWSMGATALILTLIQARYVRFLPVFTPLLLPHLITVLSHSSSICKPVPLPKNFIFALGVPISLCVAALLLIKPYTRDFDVIDFMGWDQCSHADFGVINEIAPAKLITPPGISFKIAQRASVDDFAVTIASLPFHRAAPGISKMTHIFAGKDKNLREKALQEFDLLVVCARDELPPFVAAPFYQKLVFGHKVDGLNKIERFAHSGLNIYRVNR